MTNDTPQPPARRKAVALRYDPDANQAPRVVAKGQGYVAERIETIAREHGVHIHEDPQLAGVLARLDLDTEIPESMYRAVAEVLAFVFRLNQKAGRGKPGNNLL